ncbi:MAG: D-alanyl-D-alanine carboxypeptidase [Holophagaceae bacterium]|nr:D-alanyl-D-alanine carboxypeptidase [Holophagaceae bacterium]
MIAKPFFTGFFRIAAVMALTLTAGPAMTREPGWVPHLQARGIRVSAGVWELDTGKLIEGYQTELGLVPASTTKVVSSYAILRTLKPDYQWSTTVLGDLQKGAVTGDLVIVGGGDPFFTNEHIWMLARELKAKGVSKVAGSLRLDQSAFDSQRYGTGWENTSSDTTPPILPLSVNFNRTARGNITREPEKLAMDVITAIFQNVGITFEGKPDGGGQKTVIATYKSPTLHSLTNSVNKISNNFMTEMLVKNFGAGSWARGIARIQDFYKTNLGLEPSDIHITDGSGLSKLNRLSARTLSIILRAAWHDFEVGPEFVASLKYIGAEPNDPRIKDPNLTRRVRCKTGHLDNVDTMCGYIHMPDGSMRVFAILLNGPCTWQDVEYILKVWAN